MQLSLFARHVRAALEESPDALPLGDLLALVDEFIQTCTTSSEQTKRIDELQDELQRIYHDLVDHSAPSVVLFLSILHRFQPILSSDSIISIWFDLVLRPSLREPKLPNQAVSHAKELVLLALHVRDDQPSALMATFRRRLFDLYLLDVFNEGSNDDMLEWVELGDDEKVKRQRWKANLEDVLISFGRERPEDLMTETYTHFMTPSSRLQLLIFLDIFVADISFPTTAPILAKHPLMSSLLSSLLIDRSSTSCSVGLAILIKILPQFAVHACQELIATLPWLLAILQRILCWKERPPSPNGEEPGDAALEEELESDMNPTLPLRSEFQWNRLEATFVSTSSVPDVRPLFTILYYLFPCNLLHFLRNPISYLQNSHLECPYSAGWDRALDESELRSKSERLIRSHVCHMSIIWSSASAELSEPMFWHKYDISRIATESRMLDIRNASLGHRARRMDTFPDSQPKTTGDEDASSSALIDPAILSPGRVQVSLEKMISVSIALKSNLQVDVMEPTNQWSRILFPAPGYSPQKAPKPLPDMPVFMPDDDQASPHITQALSSLMREVLLLRNELNFELWLSRENVKHVGRLYQDRLLSKNAEAERQGLYNKLRRYRTQVVGLERELEEHKTQAASTKSKYEDWNSELQQKLRTFRKDKDNILKECSELRASATQAQSMFEAQKTLLADATKQVFELRTAQKEVQHKIDRLRDYEKQIEQHVKIQSLWDEDFAKFNERSVQIEEMQGRLQQLQQQIRSYEQTTRTLEAQGRDYRREIQTLETRLSRSEYGTTSSKHQSDIALLVSEKAELRRRVDKLHEDNSELIEEVENLRATVEVLNGEIDGRRGVLPES